VNYLIDTDIRSAHLKSLGKVSSRFEQHSGRLFLSVVSLAELYTWALRPKSSPKHLRGLLTLISDVTVLNVDHEIARKFGEVRGKLLDQGQIVPGIDMLLAATALVHNLTLVTHNIRHFTKIPGLGLDDWLAPQ
jgi:tRNA(fMet)-specific endonuclease VapC